MKKVALILAVAIFGLFLTQFHVLAKQPSEIHTGQWNGGPYNGDDGKFSHCFISADYDSGIRIVFTLLRSYKFSMGFIRPGWNLTIGQEYAIKYWIDKYKVRNGIGVAGSDSRVGLDFERTEALFEEMRRGYGLHVRTAEQDFFFNLKDTYRALRDLRACVDSGRSNMTDHERGMDAWHNRDYRGANQIFRQLAEKGNAKGQFSLGIAYLEGQGVQKDSTEAAMWFRKAAKQNHGDAHFLLGIMHLTGRGYPKNAIEAVKWFRLGAAQGAAAAQNALGNSYYRGEGVQQDYAEALKWFHKSADQGAALAQTSLGVLYSNGRGTPKDNVKAYFWASLAAIRGDKNAIKVKVKLTNYLTPAQIAMAQDLANIWQPGKGQTGPSAEPNSSTQGKLQPDDIAVVIGNANYRKHGRDIPNVTPAVNDAIAVKRHFTQALGVRGGNVIYIENATSAQMVGVFGNERSHKGKLFNWVKPNVSRVYVYYAGHGAPSVNSQSGLLVPTDSDADNIDLTGYPLATLYGNLGKLPAKSVTVIIEACFSGLTQTGWLSPKASGIAIKYRPPQIPKNLTVITAGAADQIASWKKDESNSLFTSYFLEGMSGEADRLPHGNNNGHVSYQELGKYLEATMTYDARRYYGRDQNAQIVVGSGG